MSYLQAPLYPLAAVGLAALALGGMLAVPVKRPPPLASVHEGARRIDATGLPDLSRFQARDGTWLAYRLYPAASDRVAILIHGSTAVSRDMNDVAGSLTAAGITAVAVDMRGHGASGTRGDVAYVGQLDDDLADLLAALAPAYPNARVSLIGHSLGGGFVARVAGTPLGRRFDHLVMLAPYLGPRAPTNKPGDGGWSGPDLPRIVALTVLAGFGVTAGQSLPVIHYATPDGAELGQTPVYSYRLLTSFSPSYDWSATAAGLRAAAPRVSAVAGADDEMMDAEGYARALPPLGVDVTVLPGVDHMGVVYEPAALAAIVAAVKREPRGS
jgi:pimeloyl-ACP methyl ester carboxylesterase